MLPVGCPPKGINLHSTIIVQSAAPPEGILCLIMIEKDPAAGNE